MILPAAAALAVALAQPLTAAAETTKADSLGITVRDSLSQGLVVWAVNAYCPSRDWEGLVQDLAVIRPAILETAFGDEQSKRLDEELQDLHVRILEGLRARITRGALRNSDWLGRYELTLTVQGFEVRDLVRTPGVEATLSTRLLLRQVETGDRLHSEVIAAKGTRYPSGPPVELKHLLEETITSAYKALAARSPGDR